MISAYIVIRLSVFRNYAILPFKGHHRFCNLSKSHFGNVAGGKAQGIECAGRIEIDNILKVLTLEIFLRINAEPFHHHIRNAVGNNFSVYGGNIVLVQFLQKAVVYRVEQITGIIGKIVLGGVLCRTHNCVRKALAVIKRSEGAFKGFGDFLLIFRLHFPNGNGTGILAWMGIGNIEVMDKALTAPAYIVKDRNTRRTSIYPSAESAVPTLNFKNCGSVRSLCEHQKLFIKAQLIVSAGRSQKGFPILRRGYHRLAGTVVQFGNKVILTSHRETPPYLS
ncbi:TPA: hypothetical protein ACHBD8_000275 [Enterococcus faecium]